MQGLCQTFFSTLFQPASLKQYAHRRYWWQAAVLVLLIATFEAFSAAGEYRLSAGQMGLLLGITWGSALLSWWLTALLLQFTADLFGGRGRFADTMTGVGLAVVPFVLLSPLLALPNLLGRTGYTLGLLGAMGLIFWGLSLCVIGLSAAQHFSIDRSIGALVLGFVFAIALVLGGALLGMMQISFWISQLLS